MEGIILDAKRKTRSKKILNDLDDIDYYVSPSSIYKKSKDDKKEEKEIIKKEKSKKNNILGDDFIDDEWSSTISSFKAPKIKKKSKSFFGDFDTGKKKKKKKQKDGELKDYKKEFEPEMILLRNLQIEQNKFVDSLQKKYNQLENTKSTARGVSKYTTDLIDSITSARQLSMQLIDKVIATKKTISDLNFKEKKEFGSNTSSEQQNLTNYASTYLKQIMDVGRNNVVGQQDSYPNFDEINDDNDDDYNDLFDSIDTSLGDDERSEETEKYLKYENDNVQVRVVWHDSIETDDITKKYDFEAYDKDGNLVEDYPLPEKTRMNLNRANGTCTDAVYGVKYKLYID